MLYVRKRGSCVALLGLYRGEYDSRLDVQKNTLFGSRVETRQVYCHVLTNRHECQNNNYNFSELFTLL